MGSMASKIANVSIVCSTVWENAKVPRHWPLWGESTGDRHVDSPHKGPVTCKMFPHDDVIMEIACRKHSIKLEMVMNINNHIKPH